MSKHAAKIQLFADNGHFFVTAGLVVCCFSCSFVVIKNLVWVIFFVIWIKSCIFAVAKMLCKVTIYKMETIDHSASTGVRPNRPMVRRSHKVESDIPKTPECELMEVDEFFDELRTMVNEYYDNIQD